MPSLEQITAQYIVSRMHQLLQLVNRDLHTTMLSGAAKTLIERETHIHPRTWTRREPCTAKCVTKRIRTKDPTFIAKNSFKVNFCIYNQQLIYIRNQKGIVQLLKLFKFHEIVDGSYPSISWGIGDVQDDVDDLNDTSK